MHTDPLMSIITGTAFVLLLLVFFLKKIKQPYVIGYLIAGVLIGPYGLSLISDSELVSRLGSIGVLLLLFFVGMEISLPRLVANWRITVIGTTFQILVSIGCIWIFGLFLNWPFSQIVLLGFVISLSSTSVVLKILQDWKELNTQAGQDVLGILLAQDLALIPMLITVSLLGGETLDVPTITLQVIGGILVTALFVWLIAKGEFHFPFSKLWKGDHEVEIIGAIVVFSGFAFISGLFELSTALGAFIAGILVSVARETHWVHKSLSPFYTVFVALFFLSVGIILNVDFLFKYWLILILMVFAVFLTNTFINAIILRLLGVKWRRGLYVSALLAQVGEFSFIVVTAGFHVGIIDDFSYQVTITMISLTLLLSPAWIWVFKKLTGCPEGTCI